MNSFEFSDELIREYLLFRGFHTTLKSFDQEVKADKLANFDADKLTWSLIQSAQTLDFTSIKETWNYLHTFVFVSFLSKEQLDQAKLLETSLYKYFIVCAMTQRKLSKIIEFFQSHSDVLLQPEWLHWSSILYIKKPELLSPFDLFFTKLWFDLFHTSLKNFLTLAFHSMPLPKLLKFNKERLDRKNLELEISKLKETLEDLKLTESFRSSTSSLNLFTFLGTFHDPLEAEKKMEETESYSSILDISDIQSYPDTLVLRCVTLSLDGQYLLFVEDSAPCILKESSVATFTSIHKNNSILYLEEPILAVQSIEPKKGVVITSSSLRIFSIPHSPSHSESHLLPISYPFSSSSSSSIPSSFHCYTLLYTKKSIVLAYAFSPSTSSSSLSFIQWFPPYKSKSLFYSIQEPVQQLSSSKQDRFLIVCFTSQALIYDISSFELLHRLPLTSTFAFCFCPSDSHVTLVSQLGEAMTFTCVEGVQDLLQSYAFTPWVLFPINSSTIDLSSPHFSILSSYFILHQELVLFSNGYMYQVGTGKKVAHFSLPSTTFPSDSILSSPSSSSNLVSNDSEDLSIFHPSSSTSSSSSSTPVSEPFFQRSPSNPLFKQQNHKSVWACMDWKANIIVAGLSSGGISFIKLNSIPS